jgi:hypothetical protein
MGSFPAPQYTEAPADLEAVKKAVVARGLLRAAEEEGRAKAQAPRESVASAKSFSLNIHRNSMKWAIEFIPKLSESSAKLINCDGTIGRVPDLCDEYRRCCDFMQQSYETIEPTIKAALDPLIAQAEARLTELETPNGRMV